MENGYANKHFMPKGKTDDHELRQGFWKDYEVIQDYNMQTVKGTPQQEFGYYLLYGEGNFVDGKRQGPWKFYVIQDKTFKKHLHLEVSFTDGKKEGKGTHYFPSGKKASVMNYVADHADGESKWYFEEGQLRGITHYKNDQRDGEFKYYYPGGQLQYEMSYVNDSLEGKWQSFYENGQLQETETYINGKISGIYQYYYSNGQLWIEKEYRNGLLWNIHGSYDQKGGSRDFGTLKDGNGTVKYYTEEGKVYTIQTFENGIKIKAEDQ